MFSNVTGTRAPQLIWLLRVTWARSGKTTTLSGAPVEASISQDERAHRTTSCCVSFQPLGRLTW